MENANWIDISIPVRSGMIHWPDNPPVEVERLMVIEKGDTANVSKFSFGSHTGTHMDAPLHFLADGAGMDQMPLEATIGPARVIQIEDPESVKPAELEPHDLRAGERVLFKTRNSSRPWYEEEFDEDFVYVSQGAARFLADAGVRTVGVDYLSVGGFHKDGVETHEALLGAGVWVIEGLYLADVEPGGYELVCLPVNVLDGDGAPARAVLRSVRA